MSNEWVNHVKHEYTLNPVTGLDFYHSLSGRLLLLVGEGLYLKIYDVGNSELLAQCRVFESQTIHGITVKGLPLDQTNHRQHGLRVVIWGGKSYCLIDDLQVDAIIARHARSLAALEATAPDWLLDVQISSPTGDNSCLLVTAHGSVLRQTKESENQEPLETLVHASQAIYYSAHVLRVNINCFLVALGSVFGEVEVLRYERGVVNKLFTFVGHEGSIFGVEISQIVRLPDGIKTRLLVSCSDDRTIRIWNIGSDDGHGFSGSPQSAQKQQILERETGFGENSQHLDHEDDLLKPLAMAMGHVSRIWRGKFFISPSKHDNCSMVNLLSFGEDATCQQWSLDWPFQHLTASNTLGQPTLNHVRTFSYHSGKHLWSSALLIQDKGVCQVATGGADGKITTFEVAMTSQDTRVESGNEEDSTESSSKSLSWPFAAILDTLVPTKDEETAAHGVSEQPIISPPDLLPVSEHPTAAVEKKKKPKKPFKVFQDAFNRYTFISENEMLATTSSGRLLLGSVQNPHKWKELHMPKDKANDLRSYSIITGITSQRAAFLVGVNDTVYLYQHGRDIEEVARLPGPGKVASLLRIPGAETSRIQLLATSLGGTEATILCFDVRTQGISLNFCKSIALLHDFVVTATGEVNGMLVLGSRSGTLAVYDIEKSQGFMTTASPELDAKNEAVTCITRVVTAPHPHGSYFIATSRGGSYSIYLLSTPASRPNEPTINIVHHTHPPFSTIDSAWFQGSILFLSGFRGKSFIVWNATYETEVLNVICGGSHRNYAYNPSFSLSAHGAGTFIYTKASHVHFYSQNKPSHTVIKPGGHGREIKAAAAVCRDQQFLATGSEDTNIKIWRYNLSAEEEPLQGTVPADELPLTCLATIQKHTTGIQALEFLDYYEDDAHTHLFSSSGYEEFHIWRLTSIPGFGLGIVLEGSLPLELRSAERDLRITSFTVERLPPIGTRQSNQPRITPCRISLAYSDSTIKVLNYTRGQGFKLLCSSRYTSACLTQIQRPPFSRRGTNLITASTDGHIAHWQITNTNPDYNTPPTNTLTLTHREKLHQNAILAMATTISHSNDYYILTGGDDNSIVLSQYHHQHQTTSLSNTNTNSIPPLLTRLRIPNAHAAAITGLQFISDTTGGIHEHRWLRFFSVSIDQVLKRWTVEIIPGPPPSGSNHGTPSTNGIGQESNWTGTVMGMRVRDMGVDGSGREAWEGKLSTGDVGGCVVFRNGWFGSRVMVFGAGIEVWSVRDGWPEDIEGR